MIEPTTAPEPEKDRNLEVALVELRRIAVLAARYDELRKSVTAELVPLLRQRGSVLVSDPTDGKPKVATVSQAEVLEVDPAKLYEALLKQYDGDVEAAEVVYRDVLKPPAVDTRDEGAFVRAVGEERISLETVAACSQYVKRAAYVSFTAGRGR